MKTLAVVILLVASITSGDIRLIDKAATQVTGASAGKARVTPLDQWFWQDVNFWRIDTLRSVNVDSGARYPVWYLATDSDDIVFQFSADSPLSDLLVKHPVAITSSNLTSYCAFMLRLMRSDLGDGLVIFDNRESFLRCEPDVCRDRQDVMDTRHGSVHEGEMPSPWPAETELLRSYDPTSETFRCGLALWDAYVDSLRFVEMSVNRWGNCEIVLDTAAPVPAGLNDRDCHSWAQSLLHRRLAGEHLPFKDTTFCFLDQLSRPSGFNSRVILWQATTCRTSSAPLWGGAPTTFATTNDSRVFLINGFGPTEFDELLDHVPSNVDIVSASSYGAFVLWLMREDRNDYLLFPRSLDELKTMIPDSKDLVFYRERVRKIIEADRSPLFEGQTRPFVVTENRDNSFSVNYIVLIPNRSLLKSVRLTIHTDGHYAVVSDTMLE